MFEFGDPNDTKIFMEGKGRLQNLKNVNISSRIWVGIPIILAVNYYHPLIDTHNLSLFGKHSLEKIAKSNMRESYR